MRTLAHWGSQVQFGPGSSPILEISRHFGRARAVCVTGPSGSVDVTISLAERPRAIPDVVYRSRVTVPLDPEEWRSIMAEIRRDEDISRSYDNARWGVVQVNAGRFGSADLEFERSLPPLRWRSRSNSSTDSPLSIELPRFPVQR